MRTLVKSTFAIANPLSVRLPQRVVRSSCSADAGAARLVAAGRTEFMDADLPVMRGTSPLIAAGSPGRVAPVFGA
jgi:hypothetical protein